MTVRLVWTLALLAGLASAENLGNVASIEDFPSLAQVEVNEGLVWVQQAVATVLTNRHVLSSASCFSGALYNSENRRIRVGTSYRGVGGEVFGVESVEVHPSFGLLGSDADLALVKLDDYLTLSPTVQQVPILGQGIELPYGLQVQLAGWGATVQGRESSNSELHSLVLYVHDSETCMIRYYGDQIITENMICAGLSITQGRAFNSLDLGAPLLYSNTLIGILSFGQEANDELPLVATNIGSYTEWIINNAATL